jgi:hypothetical protein
MEEGFQAHQNRSINIYSILLLNWRLERTRSSDSRNSFTISFYDISINTIDKIFIKNNFES